jgi:hypothetical protein
METFEKIDELLQGLLANSYGGFAVGSIPLSRLEFGEPHRVVYEPIQASEGSSAVVKKILACRRISIGPIRTSRPAQ